MEAIDLALASAGRQPIAITLTDAATLYQAWAALKAKSLDLSTATAGTLEPIAGALARTAVLADALLKDPTQAPRIVTLLQNLKL